VAQRQRFIDRFKAKASKAKQAQSRVKALARMEKLGPVLTSSDFQFEFREPVSLPNPMLAFSVMSCGYGGVPIVSNVNRSVLAGQRIGILGANGQGKSTLVKTIAKEIPLVAGEVTEGKGLSIGYFAQQELDVLSLDDGPLMHMVRLARDVGPQAREQELRDFLGSFRFVGDMVTQAVGSLSGGEKARLVLEMLVWQRPNLLLLDEPTNHLDLTTREALSMALNEFEGTVMLVSHDRALLREVCDEFWLVSDGAVKPFDGDLDDYQKWLLETSREMAKGAREAGSAKVKAKKAEAAAAAAAPKAAKDDRKAGAQQRQKAAEQTKPLRTELATLEKRIATLTQEKANIGEASARPDVSAAQRVEQGKRLKQLGDELDAAEGRWLEVTGELDALGAG
jgi:ATP-binding cassette subfamily F protein 3